ncbi:MAG: BMP family ABC transporter substrate-binding protein, partial [Desulfobulbaceae bacterium]
GTDPEGHPDQAWTVVQQLYGLGGGSIFVKSHPESEHLYVDAPLNPDAEVLRQYAESFTDAAKGKAITNNMYQQGADIVFHASGGVGDGVIEAAKEKGKWAIGVDKDQNFLAPDNVLTSAMKRVDNAIYDIGKRLIAGEFAGGETVVYNLKNDGVGIAPTSDKHVPAKILIEVDDLVAKIKAGEIVVPATKEAFDKF